MTTPDITTIATPATSTQEKVPTVTYQLPQGTLQIPVEKLPPHVRVLINSVQERRRTISYLNDLITSLTEANGADTAIIQGAFQEIATANPELVKPREESTSTNSSL
jgi:hypothetical protein